nr:unnamed protein product [Digitaria exilis]
MAKSGNEIETRTVKRQHRVDSGDGARRRCLLVVLGPGSRRSTSATVPPRDWRSISARELGRVDVARVGHPGWSGGTWLALGGRRASPRTERESIPGGVGRGFSGVSTLVSGVVSRAVMLAAPPRSISDSEELRYRSCDVQCEVEKESDQLHARDDSQQDGDFGTSVSLRHLDQAEKIASARSKQPSWLLISKMDGKDLFAEIGMREEDIAMMLFGKKVAELAEDTFDGSKEERQIFEGVFCLPSIDRLTDHRHEGIGHTADAGKAVTGSNTPSSSASNYKMGLCRIVESFTAGNLSSYHVFCHGSDQQVCRAMLSPHAGPSELVVKWTPPPPDRVYTRRATRRSERARLCSAMDLEGIDIRNFGRQRDGRGYGELWSHLRMHAHLLMVDAGWKIQSKPRICIDKKVAALKNGVTLKAMNSTVTFPSGSEGTPNEMLLGESLLFSPEVDEMLLGITTDVNNEHHDVAAVSDLQLADKDARNGLSDIKMQEIDLQDIPDGNWSDFVHLNHKGFYTIALENDDSIISVASIRLHGAIVAEMPLIATCTENRQQGMCRRLMDYIEKLLKSLKVEMLLLSAIPQLVDTWTSTFGFREIDDSDKKKLSKVRLAQVPGTVLLKKNLCARAGTSAATVDSMERRYSSPEDLRDLPAADQSPEVSAPDCVIQSLVNKLDALKIASPSATAGGVGTECNCDEHSVTIAFVGGQPKDVVVVDGGLCRIEA